MRANIRQSQFSRQSQSRNFVARKRRRAAVGITAGAVALVAWVFVLSRLSFLPLFTISSVEVYGASPGVARAMEDAAYATLDGTYLGVFSRANSFIYPKDAVAAAAASVSPETHALLVKRTGLRSISISASDKTGAAIVCPDLPDLADLAVRPRCYIADDTGFVFRKLEEGEAGNTDASYNRYFIPNLGGERVVGTRATSTERFRELQAFVDGVKAAGISVRGVLVHESGEYELYARNPGVESIVVIHFDEKAGFDTERENLVAFWNRMVADARAKHRSLEWNDIKLQYPPNVYYTEAK